MWVILFMGSSRDTRKMGHDAKICKDTCFIVGLKIQSQNFIVEAR